MWFSQDCERLGHQVDADRLILCDFHSHFGHRETAVLFAQQSPSDMGLSLCVDSCVRPHLCSNLQRYCLSLQHHCKQWVVVGSWQICLPWCVSHAWYTGWSLYFFHGTCPHVRLSSWVNCTHLPPWFSRQLSCSVNLSLTSTSLLAFSQYGVVLSLVGGLNLN